MIRLFSPGSSSNLRTVSVQLANTRVSVPVASFPSAQSNKYLLITAGMDGDEYAGIEAAYRLIAEFSKQPPHISTTIIPIVNIPGFFAKTSDNPLDHRYPKHAFPGKQSGSPTEQLLFWLSSQHLPHQTLWIDLHSGNLTEYLTPFIWTYQTKRREIDTLIWQVLQQFPDTIKIYDTHMPPAVKAAAKRSIPYILLESGQKGERTESAITQHIQWIMQITSSYQSIFSSSTQPAVQQTVYQHVHEYFSQKQGIWRPTRVSGEIVHKAAMLGHVYSLTGKIIQTISAGETGIVLWGKTSMAVSRGEEVVAVATDPTKRGL